MSVGATNAILTFTVIIGLRHDSKSNQDPVTDEFIFHEPFIFWHLLPICQYVASGRTTKQDRNVFVPAATASLKNVCEWVNVCV